MCDSRSPSQHYLAGRPSPRPQPWRWRTLFGWLMTLVLLAGVAWLVPLREVWQTLLRAQPWLLALAVGPVTVNLWLRGARWALLFRPHHRVGARAALGPALIGLGLNAVLPGRVGELARVVIGARTFGTSLPFTASTVVGERLLDAVTLLAFLGASLLMLPPADTPATVDVLGTRLSTEMLAGLGRRLGLGSLLLILLALGLMSPALRGVLLRALRRLPRVGPELASWSARVLGEAGLGLTALRHPHLLARAVMLSLVIWLALALANVVVSKAIPGVDLNVPQALVVTAISVVASGLPSAPGAWGVYEAGILLALALIQVAPASGAGIAFALASHLCSYLPVVVLGAVAGFRLRWSPGSTPPANRKT